MEIYSIMVARADSMSQISEVSLERISYIKQMLAELAQVARAEHADLLAYLLEMAFTEAADLMSGVAPSTSTHVNGHLPTRMPVKPAGKI
jgi:hypothetical protein